MKRRMERRRGSAILEMAFVTIPLIFFLLSTIEIARGLWLYSTLAAAVKRSARFLTVHGASCVESAAACQSTVGEATHVITQYGLGLDASKLQLTFTANGQTYTCATAASCASDGTAWPPSAASAAGMRVTIKGRYRFESALGILWPQQLAGAFDLSASSTESIQF
jgi:Flp pilus assembly protein TadG